MSKSKVFSFKEKELIKKLLQRGYKMSMLADEAGYSLHSVRTELKAGLSDEDWKKKLLGKYSPELATYKKLLKFEDEESISKFVKWYMEKKNE